MDLDGQGFDYIYYTQRESQKSDPGSNMSYKGSNLLGVKKRKTRMGIDGGQNGCNMELQPSNTYYIAVEMRQKQQSLMDQSLMR